MPYSDTRSTQEKFVGLRHPPSDPVIKRLNHPCEGHCGRIVSGNKRKCLKCLGIEVRLNLEAQGHEVDEEDLRRLMVVHASG